MKYIYPLTFFVFLFSCNLVNSTKKLGNGYYFDTDAIIYTEKKTYEGVGFTVIPAKVLSFVFDDSFIIVSSLKSDNEAVFWIIDKKKEKREIQYIEGNENYNSYYQYSNIFGPMDKSEFTTKTKKLGINLKLE